MSTAPSTSTGEQPPTYTAATTEPPAYAPPSRYCIGRSVVLDPFVTVAELKDHLALLRAFKKLRTDVEAGNDPRLPEEVRTMEAGPRWAWFVTLAVERFHKWLPDITLEAAEQWAINQRPPLDVMMVWHAYMLNPVWYEEDCDRLLLMKIFTALAADCFTVCMKDVDTYVPTGARRQRWRDTTKTRWDIMDSMSRLRTRRVECPKCYQITAAPFVASEGRGYAQHKFAVLCNFCNFVITKGGLATLKFARDLIREPKNTIDIEKYGNGVYMAGTLANPNNAADTVRALRIKTRLWKCSDLAPPKNSTMDVWLKQILEKSEWTISKMLPHVRESLHVNNRRRAGRIMGAYVDDRPFSVELVGAVLRQCSFIDKMVNFGWTEPGYFDSEEDEIVLVHAIARYHAFLDLMASAPGFFVPTLDIDMAWHTHQLRGWRYGQDCMKYVKRYIDHDDRVEEEHLATSFDLTCRAWEDKYGIPYTYCGCPLPGTTAGQRLARFKRSISIEIPLTDGLTPPSRRDALFATHASDHNSIALPFNHKGLTEAQRQKRVQKAKKRRERDEKKVREGKMREEELHRGGAHDVAFLYPVPFIYTAPVSGCAGVSSAGCDGAGSACAVGAGACNGTGCGGSACGTGGCASGSSASNVGGGGGGGGGGSGGCGGGCGGC